MEARGMAEAADFHAFHTVRRAASIIIINSPARSSERRRASIISPWYITWLYRYYYLRHVIDITPLAHSFIVTIYFTLHCHLFISPSFDISAIFLFHIIVSSLRYLCFLYSFLIIFSYTTLPFHYRHTILSYYSFYRCLIYIYCFISSLYILKFLFFLLRHVI